MYSKGLNYWYSSYINTFLPHYFDFTPYLCRHFRLGIVYVGEI